MSQQTKWEETSASSSSEMSEIVPSTQFIENQYGN